MSIRPHSTVHTRMCFHHPHAQVFVKGEFIGGADILYEMHQKEELAKLLEPIIKEQQAAAKK